MVLLKEAVAAAGADTAVLTGVTRNRVLQLKSYQQTHKADVLWTGRKGCYKAFRRTLNTTHAVSCAPGIQALSDKGALVGSLEAAYGEAAWGVVPRSFRLPQQFTALLDHLREEHAAGRGGGLWVLKENVHRGKGVGVVTPPQLLLRALQRSPKRGDGALRHVLAQQFLGNQLLVAGRPFYMRVWTVLMGADPVRAYLFDGGVVVFGKQQRAAQEADDLIVNLWTQDRKAAAPWSLAQLEAHLAGEAGGVAGGADERGEAVRRMRRRLHAVVAASMAASVPSMRRATRTLPGFQGGSFEVLGVDFLVDAELRPWLVEVNYMPSMARKLIGCAARAGNASSGAGAAAAAATCQQDNPFDVEKERFMKGLLGLLLHRHARLPVAEAQAGEALRAAKEVAEPGSGAPCVGPQRLAHLLALKAEQAAAEQLGFVPLTQLVYDSLSCTADGGSACGVLAELSPPQPAAQRAQQCSAPTSRAEQLVGRLRHWQGRLLLEGANLASWAVNHKARNRVAKVAKRAAKAPTPMLAADRRVLTWMQRGMPHLGTPQAVQEFCDASNTAAAASE